MGGNFAGDRFVLLDDQDWVKTSCDVAREANDETF